MVAFLINRSSSSITLPSLFIDVLFSDVDIRNIYNVPGSRVRAVNKTNKNLTSWNGPSRRERQTINTISEKKKHRHRFLEHGL